MDFFIWASRGVGFKYTWHENIYFVFRRLGMYNRIEAWKVRYKNEYTCHAQNMTILA